MKKNKKRGRVVRLILIFIIIIFATGWSVYQSNQKSKGNNSINSAALMTLSYSGGNCAGPCNSLVYNLYGDGRFEGHKKLSGSEVSELKEIIKTTDFLNYTASPNPHCESFVDGSDQVLLFPQKYGNKTFTTCMLNISSNDTAFSFINKLIETHSGQ